MFLGYAVLFQIVYVAGGAQLTLRESFQVTMAGLAATRLFSTGGAGGIVLTAWAMRRAGMSRRAVADRTIAFLVLTYLVYTLSIVIFGYGLRLGIFPGEHPFGLTVVPATIALAATVIGLSIGFVPTDIQRRLDTFAERGGRIGRLAQRLASAPGIGLDRHPHRARPHSRARSGDPRGDRLLGLPDRLAVGVLSRLRRRAPVRRARARLLPRPTRATSCRSRAGSAGWTAG